MADLKLTTRAEDFSEWYNQVVLPGRVGNWRGGSESLREPRFQLPPHHT
jgi:hypothetical protein